MSGKIGCIARVIETNILVSRIYAHWHLDPFSPVPSVVVCIPRPLRTRAYGLTFAPNYNKWKPDFYTFTAQLPILPCYCYLSAP